MSTQSSRGLNLRGYRRRKAALDLDLNSAPPGDIWGQEGTSTQVRSQESQSRPQGNSIPITTIDVEAIDDDVIESSPRAFAAAKNNRRNRGITGMTVVDVESEEWNRITHINKRRRTAPNQTIINCDFYINLESSANSASEVVPKPPPPPKEPTFSCPICMGHLVEEMSTKCGHIFCKACIKAAIAAQGKCPTCRKRVTSKELIRVFLPAAS
uniref:RING-type domain-containing protein n=1 Tax=Cannabis sativa TaxID=3483 RepID=A0A803PG20_CANSA